MGHPALLIIVGKYTHAHTQSRVQPISFDKIFVRDRRFSMFLLSEAEPRDFRKSYNKGD